MIPRNRPLVSHCSPRQVSCTMCANRRASSCQGIGVWAIMAAQHRRRFLGRSDGRQPGPEAAASRAGQGQGPVLARPRTALKRTGAMFGFGSSRNDPLADARSAERWIAAGVTSDALTMHERIRSVLAEVTAPGVALTPKRLAALFVIDAHAPCAVQGADGAVHRSRRAQREDRAPDLVGDLRPHAGVPVGATRTSAASRSRMSRTRNGGE